MKQKIIFFVYFGLGKSLHSQKKKKGIPFGLWKIQTSRMYLVDRLQISKKKLGGERKINKFMLR
jgi:hypothetical protein